MEKKLKPEQNEQKVKNLIQTVTYLISLLTFRLGIGMLNNTEYLKIAFCFIVYVPHKKSMTLSKIDKNL